MRWRGHHPTYTHITLHSATILQPDAYAGDRGMILVDIDIAVAALSQTTFPR